MVDRDPHSKVPRRIGGVHSIRTDGLSDLLTRADGASVLDLGCNRGMIAYEFARYGAKLVHGCDYSFDDAIRVAQNVFADMREVESRFEVIDLAKGAHTLEIFGGIRYDFVLMFGLYHKLKRQMAPNKLAELVRWCADHTSWYFVWRGFAEEIPEVDHVMKDAGLKMVHWTELSDLGPGVIWQKSSS